MCTSGKVSNSVTQMSLYFLCFICSGYVYLLMAVAPLSPLARIGSGDNEYGNLAGGIWSRCQRVKVKSLVEQDMGGWTVEFALSTSSQPECCTKQTGYVCWTSVDFWCLFLQDYSRSRKSCWHAWSGHKGWQWTSTNPLLQLHSITLTFHRVTRTQTLTKPSFAETIPLDVAFTGTFTV